MWGRDVVLGARIYKTEVLHDAAWWQGFVRRDEEIASALWRESTVKREAVSRGRRVDSKLRAYMVLGRGRG